MKNLKKITAIFLLLFFFLLSSVVFAFNGDTIVYKTATGECYHTGDCYHLRSKIEVTLYDAVSQGLRACLDCNPPIPDFPYSIPTPQPTKTPTKSHSSSGVSQSTEASVSNANSPDSNKNINTKPLLWTAGVILVGLPTVGIVIDSIQTARWKRRFNKEKEEYASLYGGRDIETLVTIPRGCSIGEDSLPRTKNAYSNWGNDFTFWVTKTGQAYHCKRGCSGAYTPVNALSLKTEPPFQHRPCSRCKPKLPELDWALEAKRILDIKKKYGID